MRIDLPKCSFKNCKYHLDCNCTSRSRYDICEFREAKEEVEVLNAIIKEDCGMLPDYEKYLGNKIRKEFGERLKNSIKESVDDAWHGDGNGIYDAENVLDDIDNLLKKLEEK